MIASRYPKSTGFTSHSSSCTVYCNGTRMRAYCRHEVTVVQVTGEVDATNIDRLYEYIHRFVAVAPGLIVDLSEVDFICAKGIFALRALANECRAAKTGLAVVTGAAAARLLRIGDPNGVLLTAASEREALTLIAARRPTKLTAS